MDSWAMRWCRMAGWASALSGALTVGCSTRYATRDDELPVVPTGAATTTTIPDVPPGQPVVRQVREPRIYNPGPQPDSTSSTKYGIDGEWNGVMGTRTQFGGEAWSGGPSAHPYEHEIIK